ncbi:hypothetical protein ACIOZM_24775 [Pseudomonas sp. NPDC087346]|uniref:hypothetical protein n=1 Tax=Pseudomonas sp. NPDC087346 TaxID=3364438 RepID=UPI00381843DD
MKVYKPDADTSNERSTGTLQATIPNEPEFKTTHALLHLFGGEKPGGFIIGFLGDRFIDIGFPQGIGDTDGYVTKKYPEDFSTTDLQWDYQPQSGNRVIATSGTITVRFSDGKKKAEGKFEFDTNETTSRKIKGTFQLENT